MKIKTLTPELVAGKIVLVRVDFNVPLKNGKITEKTRIVESLPTLEFLLKNGAKKIHLLAHLGRPGGKICPEFSLAPVAAELEKLLKKPVEFRSDFTAGSGKIQLHENVRFYPGEKKNDPALATEILEKTGAEIFVNDGFGVSHRAQTSVIGFSGKIPCVAGKLVEKEIEHLSPFLSAEKIPGLTVAVGGVKMETKVAVLKHFCQIAENVIIGGALANTFLAAQGFDIGESLCESDFAKMAREVLEIAETHKTAVHLPIDVQCADDPDGKSVYLPTEDVAGSLKIFDIGPHSIASYREVLKHSKVVIWNGPLGFFEKPPFDSGTRAIAEEIAQNQSAKTILGGGDTLGVLKQFGIEKSKFTHVSTGGGAMLEFLEGKKLPGIEILKT
ncbi:phosphoglycerate kinase [bacterium]|jgi:phosphoglycerate kinase|nr:phosphoglycerate kinase [bacterium]MBT6832179.1 phosphoglycerate kinase [bacterium]MBT6996124.1 phosphoglycerate kinase [bacterium]MBT7772204.1 phosphoglycerate kinase [bacterium]